jgi:hypothetical protein
VQQKEEAARKGDAAAGKAQVETSNVIGVGLEGRYAKNSLKHLSANNPSTDLARGVRSELRRHFVWAR